MLDQVQIDACWEFRCPECGITDTELGGLARDHEIYCVVCEHEHGTLVRLERWAAGEDLTPRRAGQDLTPPSVRPATMKRRSAK